MVELEQTTRRGRAAIAKLTPEGLVLYRQLQEATRKRQKRLVEAFTPEEVELLWTLLRRIEAQLPHMNTD